MGAGEGAFLMAEELAFQQGLGKGGTIKLDKGFGVAFAALVNSTGNQFFPRS
jgi:hypothetical protein